MSKKKLTPTQAKSMLEAAGVDFRKDFYTQGSSTVQLLLDVAKLAGYRKSKSAPGSTARMFYQYMERVGAGGGGRSHAKRKAKGPRVGVQVEAATPAEYRWLRQHPYGATLDLATGTFTVTDEAKWAEQLRIANAKEI